MTKRHVTGSISLHDCSFMLPNTQCSLMLPQTSSYFVREVPHKQLLLMGLRARLCLLHLIKWAPKYSCSVNAIVVSEALEESLTQRRSLRLLYTSALLIKTSV